MPCTIDQLMQVLCDLSLLSSSSSSFNFSVHNLVIVSKLCVCKIHSCLSSIAIGVNCAYCFLLSFLWLKPNNGSIPIEGLRRWHLLPTPQDRHWFVQLSCSVDTLHKEPIITKLSQVQKPLFKSVNNSF
jgi:hypothetical protein